MTATATVADGRNVLAHGASLFDGEFTLRRVPWWRVVMARAVWWVWPYGVLSALGCAVVIGRMVRRGLSAQTAALAIAVCAIVALSVGLVIFRRRLARFGPALCRVEVPAVVVRAGRLNARKSFEPRMLTTPVLMTSTGLALGEGAGLVRLRDIGARLEIACTWRGRIGWGTFVVGDEVARTAACGRLRATAGRRLFDDM
jgi:hypothetical protein